jgi:hypothetical protein
MFFSTGFSFTSSYCFFLNCHTDPYQSHFHCVCWQDDEFMVRLPDQVSEFRDYFVGIGFFVERKYKDN